MSLRPPSVLNGIVGAFNSTDLVFPPTRMWEA
jgi:hypothetical protein